MKESRDFFLDKENISYLIDGGEHFTLPCKKVKCTNPFFPKIHKLFCPNMLSP